MNGASPLNTKSYTSYRKCTTQHKAGGYCYHIYKKKIIQMEKTYQAANVGSLSVITRNMYRMHVSSLKKRLAKRILRPEKQKINIQY